MLLLTTDCHTLRGQGIQSDYPLQNYEVKMRLTLRIWQHQLNYSPVFENQRLVWDQYWKAVANLTITVARLTLWNLTAYDVLLRLTINCSYYTSTTAERSWNIGQQDTLVIPLLPIALFTQEGWDICRIIFELNRRISIFWACGRERM